MTTLQLRNQPVTDELLAGVLDAHGGLENWARSPSSPRSCRSAARSGAHAAGPTSTTR